MILRTMRYWLMAFVTIALLLGTAVASDGLSITGQTDGMDTQLRELLIKHAWAYDVRLGRVAIELREVDSEPAFRFQRRKEI